MISHRAQLILSLFFSQGMRICSTLVMARYISPVDFGKYLVLMATAVIGTGLGDFGVASTVVQARHIEERVAIHTAFGLGAFLFLIYGLFTIASGIYLSHTMNDTRMIYVGLIVAASGFMAQMYTIQMAYLNRRMQFRDESKQNLIFSITQALTGIILAISGMGIFAIVLQLLTAQLVANFFAYRRAPIPFPRNFSFPVAKYFITLGGKVSIALYANNLLVALINQSLNIIGKEQLVGMWNRSLNVQQLFGQNVSAALDRVFYTSFTNEINPSRKKELLIEGLSIQMFVTCGLAAWFWCCADDLVRIVLGSAWLDAIPIMRVLAIAVPAGGFYAVAYSVAYGTGKTSYLLIVNIIALSIFAPLVWCLKSQGVQYIAIMYNLSRYVISIGVLVAVILLLKGSFAKMFRSPMLSVVQAGLVGLILRFALPWLSDVNLYTKKIIDHFGYVRLAIVPSVVHLVISSFLVGLLYLAFAFVLQPTLVKRLVQLTRKPKTNSPAVA